MFTIRVKRFIKRIERKLDLNGKETVGFDRTKENRNRDAPTKNARVDTSTTNALVVQARIGGYGWRFQAEEQLTNFALMAYTSQGSSSSDSKNEAVYEEDIAFLKYDVQVKDISIKDLKNQLENALKKDGLKLKLEKFITSSKNLTKLINSQVSFTDKTGLGYDGQMNKSDLNDIQVNESEVLNNVFDSYASDGDDNQVDQPPGQKLASCKWLYKIKEGNEGVQKPRYKARLSLRQWYKRFDVYMVSNGFCRNNYDSYVYFKEFAPGLVYGRDQRKHVDVDDFVDAYYAKDLNKDSR
nr:reverse transcriptase [Tanacetum cinerariifolium]